MLTQMRLVKIQEVSFLLAIVLLPVTRPTTSGTKCSGGIRAIIFRWGLNGLRDRDLLFHYGTVKLCQSPGGAGSFLG